MDAQQIPQLRLAIRVHLETGYSLRQALADVRSLGVKIRTEDFAALWRDEQRKRERAA